MDSNKFSKILLEKNDKDYGLCPPPINAQEGLNILIEHFLGEDWFVTMPMCQEQVNTAAIYTILNKYQKKESLIEIVKNMIISRGKMI
jgi:hypothetical protein